MLQCGFIMYYLYMKLCRYLRTVVNGLEERNDPTDSDGMYFLFCSSISTDKAINMHPTENCLVPSVLWRCWLGGMKGIRPVKNEWWGVGVVVCLERGADLHMAQLMPLPLTVSCFGKIQIGFTFLVPAYPGYPGKEAVKWLLLLLLFYSPRLEVNRV